MRAVAVGGGARAQVPRLDGDREPGLVDAVADGFTAPKTLTDALDAYGNESRDIDYLILGKANIAVCVGL